MGRNNRHNQSKMRRTNQTPKSISPAQFVILSVSVIGVAAGLVFAYGWGPSTSVSYQQSAIQNDNPVPLSTRGKPISGWHDMANQPSYTYRTPPPKDTPQPDVTVTPANRDLASVGSKDVINLNYAVINQGNQDLIVDSMSTSCGCTTAELSNNIIPPGTRADLKVRFDVGFHKVEHGERVARIVWLKTNDPDTPIAAARVTATIR